MDERLKNRTRSEWRELGFFYERDDNSKEWLLVGSRRGLARFCDLLRSYVADPRSTVKSEHEHYGPYMYLEFMTWDEAGIDEHSIHGTLIDLERLAELVDAKAARLQPGDRIRIREEYASTSQYALVLHLREESFDPSSLDPSLHA